MPTRQHSEADAVAFAQRHGVRLTTARTALGVVPRFSTDVPLWPDQSEAVRAYATANGLTVLQAIKAIEADGARASQVAAASMVATFNRANGIKPSTAASDRARSKPEAAAAITSRTYAPVKTADAISSSDPKADAARASAQKAAAESAVALFIKFYGTDYHHHE